MIKWAESRISVLAGGLGIALTWLVISGSRSKTLGADEATKISGKTLSLLGVRDPLPININHAKSTNSPDLWLASFRSSTGDRYTAYIRENGQEVDMITSSREEPGAKVPAATPTLGKRLSNENAKQLMQTYAARVIGDRKVALDELVVGNTRIKAHYSCRVGGYEFVDRACALAIQLDRADGALVEYVSTLEAEVPVEAKPPKVSLEVAKVAAAQSVGWPSDGFKNATSRLGFASEKGAPSAHLCWLLQVSHLRVVVDGQSGRVILKVM